MRNITTIVLSALALALPGMAAEVWESTFETDGDTDGVVNVFDQNLNKDMLAGPVDGELFILQYDDPPTSSPPAGYPYTPDKAGRPLGLTLTAADSFSGLYKFRWSQYHGDPALQSGSIAWEQAGFFGSDTSQANQVVAVLINHWQIANGNYFVRLWAQVADNSKSCSSVVTGSILLGLDPENREFELSVGWDGTTNTIRVELVDALTRATVAAGETIITDPECIDNLQVTHLGWSDYTSNPPTVTKVTEWAVDSLSFFDTFEEAFPAPLTPGLVWRALFEEDGLFDDFVDVFTTVFLPRDMLNPAGASNGTLLVEVVDDDFGGDPYNGNKSGRALGQILEEPDSWSALYRFKWSDLPETGPSEETYGFAGAFGASPNQTRQVVGALMQYWLEAGNYYVNLGLIMGGNGSEVIDLSGPARNLGPDAELADYQLAIGWDSDQDVLLAQLYDSEGVPIGSATKQMLPIAVPTPLVTTFQMSHMGWGDYTNGGDPLIYSSVLWEVDEVAFWYDQPLAAFDEAEGNLPCDIDGDGDVDFVDYTSFEGCLAGPGNTIVPVGCTVDEFDAADCDNDGDVDLADAAVLLEVATGSL